MSKSPKYIAVENSRSGRALVVRLPLPDLSGFTLNVRELEFSFGLLAVGLFGLLSITIAPTLPAPVSQLTVEPERPVSTALARSVPTHLEIPDIGLSSSLIELGKNTDGSMETPSDYNQVGWYRHSPTPGEVGPAVIAGHVDSYLGPAVFFRLKELQPGQLVHIDRQDGTRTTFQVTKSELFDQNNFPTEAVYGDIDHPGLRLITCGGIFSYLSGAYSHNTVVFADLVSSTR